MKKKFDLIEDLQMRYPDEPLSRIKEAVEKADPKLFIDISTLDAIDSKILTNNQDFRNRVHVQLKGYPLFKHKTK